MFLMPHPKNNNVLLLIDGNVAIAEGRLELEPVHVAEGTRIGGISFIVDRVLVEQPTANVELPAAI
jgi:hypothetical protein